MLSVLSNDLAFFNSAILFDFFYIARRYAYPILNDRSGSCLVTFFWKTRLTLLPPNLNTGLFLIAVKRCFDPFIINSVFFIFNQSLFAVNHL